ncbi:MAG: MarR family transcriptional regulator [Bacteroidia bacterium]|nr:MarR family transcriptional regulator [Bacteroidia bacterium]
MKLEEEIQQSRFRNDYQKAILNIMYTGNWMENRLKRFFSEVNQVQSITLQQYNILRILNGRYPATASVNDLKDRMLDPVSDVSRIVERLRKQGLLSREVCPSDRRAVDVKITEQGRALIDQLDAYNPQMDEILGHLTPNELALLNQLLDKVRERTLPCDLEK